MRPSARPRLPTSSTCVVWAALALLLLIGGMEVGCRAPHSPPLAPQLQEVLDSLHRADGFPGATAAVVTADDSVHMLATGIADRTDSTRMSPDARMLGGSTGKSFAAAVVLSLVQDGTLALDAPIAHWLGNRDWFDRLPNADALTLHHLLRHRSGLIDHIHTDAFRHTMERRMAVEGPDATLPPSELVQFVLDTPPLFPAGTAYHYSDTNYILAGMVVEAATGRDYSDLLRDRILTPLPLPATTPATRRTLPGLVPGYTDSNDPFGLPPKVTQDGALIYNPATEWTGGGLVTTARDLAVWAKRLCEGDVLDGPYVALLLDTVPKDTTQQARFGANVGYGLGITTRKTALGPGYGHRGWTPGYQSIFEYYPRPQIAVAVQVNALGPYDLPQYAVRLATVAAHTSGQASRRRRVPN